MENRLISIVIPIYKSELFIERLYNSLKQQTYSKLEIIFVNDGSPDNSGAICDELAKLDERVIVLHQENQGAAAAITNGTSISSGDLLMYIDGDDWINPYTCEKAINALKEYQVDMVFWNRIKEFEKKSIPNNPLFPNSKLFEESDMNYLRRRMIGLIGVELKDPMKTDMLNSIWGKLYLANLIKNNNVKFTSTQKVGSTDILFNIQLIRFVKSAYYINENLHHYNKVNPNSLTKTYNTTLFGKYQNLFQEIKIVIDENYNDSVYNEAFNNRIALSTINISLSLLTNGFNMISYKGIKEMLNTKIYREAYKKIDFKFLPFPFKVFFIACRLNFPLMVLVLALIMKKIRD
ncbi:glycosyltransferase family 2 protein [Flavobacterium sp.]|uniref:glycosyltransferase family 2 protein n=1 Tax=Flavobacterium sp. TaxID=239 RepID=UPI004047AB36